MKIWKKKFFWWGIKTVWLINETNESSVHRRSKCSIFDKIQFMTPCPKMYYPPITRHLCTVDTIRLSGNGMRLHPFEPQKGIRTRSDGVSPINASHQAAGLELKIFGGHLNTSVKTLPVKADVHVALNSYLNTFSTKTRMLKNYFKKLFSNWLRISPHLFILINQYAR